MPGSVESFTDEDIVRERWWHICPGEVVIDVGVGFGSYALSALVLGAEYVFAFSPESSTTNVLITNLAINQLQDRCTILPIGLYDRDGYLQMTTQEFSESWQT